MKDIRIDFTQSEPCLDSKQLGEYGEAGVERFVITPPKDMSENENITNYIVAFATARGPVRLESVPKADVIYVPVEKAAFCGAPFSLQLEGHDNSDSLVLKTPLVRGLMFAQSVPEGNILSPDGTFTGHYHLNYDVLKNLSEVENKLAYNGKVIGKIEKRTVELSVYHGQAAVFTDHSASGTIHFMAYDKIPSDVEIVSVEFLVDNEILCGGWIDLRRLSDGYSYVPSILTMYKSFYDEGYGCIFLAAKYYFNDMYDEIYYAAQNGQISDIRVTYIVESEDE